MAHLDDTKVNSINDLDLIFKTLSDLERKLLDNNCTKKEVKKGEIVFKEGNEPEGLICLITGNIKVYKEGITGREQIVRLARTNGFIGYKALFAEQKHTTTAETIEDSTIVIFNKKILFEVIDNNPKFARIIIKLLATELGFNFRRIVSLTQKHLRGRLAETLLFLIDTYGFENDESTIKAHLSREDLAHLSNMTTSNAIRTLTTLSNEKAIELHGKNIIVLDIELLRNISEFG